MAPSFLPAHGSPRLRALQICQMTIVSLTLIATLLNAVIPSKSTKFTFGLLYSLIFTSITTTIIIRKEMIHAKAGTLTKDKYAKYQLYKMLAAAGMSFLGFIGYMASGQGNDKQKQGEQGMWLNGHKITKWHAIILWMSFFNWVFLWASLFYSCCMSTNKEGAIALGDDEESLIRADTETENDEEIARQLQADDPNWERR